MTDTPEIVIVDDEKQILEALQRLFDFEGIDVFVTIDPDEALSVIEKNSVKLIISDYRMPKINGVDLLEKVKAKRADLMRIILTGQADIQAVQDAINKVQVFRFINKPWDDDDLILTVAEAIRQYDLVKENKELHEITKMQLEELKTLDKLKSDFIANVSHELRTPVNCMNLIFSNINAGVTGPLESLPEKLQSYLLKAERNLQSLKILIDDLLDIFKLSSEGYSLNLQEADLFCEIRSEVEDIALSAEAKGVDLNVNVIGQCVYNCDKGRIRQVVRNILSNAIKFTDKGGTINVDVEENANEICCKISDTGIGIRKENLDAVFDRFRQVEEQAKGKPTGTGLGLAISQKIIELHGGKIWVESEYGKGSCFVFVLPLVNSQDKGD